MSNAQEQFLPATTYEEALQRASSLFGIQPDYWDIFGQQHFATAEAKRLVLQSMGVPGPDLEALNRAILERAQEEWGRLVPPVLVLLLSDESIPIQVPVSKVNGGVTVTFLWEGGGSTVREYSLEPLSAGPTRRIADQDFVQKDLPLPREARLGYHRMKVEGSDIPAAEGDLILCPDRAYEPEFLERGGKAAGVAISVYGLRSARNWGCGDFTDLRNFTSWAASHLDVSFIALNPLHCIPNRQPYNTSPYLPNCSFYRNGIYLDVESVPDVKNSAAAQMILKGERLQRQLEELRQSEFVEYEKVWALKRKMLKQGFRHFLRAEYRTNSARAADFAEYVSREGQLLERFALYCAVDEVLHKQDRDLWIWPQWPAAFQDPDSGEVCDFRARHWRLILFYQYVQWQLEEQLEACQVHAKQAGLAVGLYHDLALATDKCGSDLWALRPFYVEGCRVGSPPDDFSPSGQDWAFPPPNSLRHWRDGYRLFAESIRKNIKHGGALRIDHVMRFFRLFWIPGQQDATQGLYVKERADDLVRILALESVRSQVLVIGEDLGTVEPYIREALADYHVLSYRLLYFEKNKDGSFKLPNVYPRQSLASVSTHDLPTLSGFWQNRDIEARRDAGVLPDEESFQRQVRERGAEKQRMLDAFHHLRLLPDSFPRDQAQIPSFTGELHNAAVGFLASTNSKLMVLNGEDLFKETDQQNLPGTTEQYPNWRHKMLYAIEELHSNEQALACAEMFRTWLERTGRLNSQTIAVA
jgi:4-alpha-glucanotransferase